MLRFKVILLVGLLAGSTLATETIRCSSHKRNRCRVQHNLDNPSDGDKLTIENANHKSNVKAFQWIRQSKVKHIPPVIFETFQNLELVDLSIGIETIRETDFMNASNLLYLTIEKNGISRIPSNVFRRASNLNSIILDVNKITEVEGFAFKGLNKLIEIRLDYNFITSLKKNTFADAPKLRRIYLRVNEITSIEDGTFNLPRLTEIYLNSNHLQTIPDRLFANAPQLTHIDLTDNEITQLPPALFAVSKLASLVLDGNEMENVQISEFTRMKTLNYLSLEGTGISIPTEPQRPSGSMLMKIDLTDNDLSNPDILKHLRMFGNLQKIILRFNKLTRLNNIMGVKTLFPNIILIDLEENEIACYWLEVFLPQMKNLGIELITGEEDTELPADERRESVDGQLCGQIP